MSISVAFPSGKIFAKQNNVVTVTRTAAEDSLKFTLQYGDISITRTFNASASLPATLIFPVDSLFEMIVGSDATKTITAGDLSVSWDVDTEYSTNDIILVNGASFYPISDVPEQMAAFGFPQPLKTIVYKELLPHTIPCASKLEQIILQPYFADYIFNTNAQMLANEDYPISETSYAYVIEDNKFYEVNYITGEYQFTEVDFPRALTEFQETSNSFDISITSNILSYYNVIGSLILFSNADAGKEFPTNIIYNECAAKDDEVYLRWFDIYGYTLHYKFKRKELMNDFKITDTFKSFDTSLAEYKKQKKTYDKVYTLSSNLVDADTFDWLKRIGIARNVELFDGTSWVKALVGEVSISGQDEQNTVMFKVTTEELVPTL